MEPGISGQVIWPLAAEETIAGRFEYIEPAHLLGAVLKFAEMEEHHFKMMVKNDLALAVLVKERDATREMLRQHKIEPPADTAALRRALRQHLGAGGCRQGRGRTIHRSEATRRLCEVAEGIAQESGKPRWEALHVLQALLQSPDSKVANALAEAGATGPRPPAATPLLDKYGHELTCGSKRDETEGGKSGVPGAVCKVLANELFGQTRRNVLLIQAGSRTAEDVLHLFISLASSDFLPQGARGKRFVEVQLEALSQGTKTAKEAQDRLAALFDEAAEAGNVVLWFSTLHRYLAMKDSGLTALIQERLSPGRIGVIASTDESAYLEFVKQDRKWKQLFHAVWLHDMDTPLQL